MFPGVGGEGVGSQGLVQEAELLTASGLKSVAVIGGGS